MLIAYSFPVGVFLMLPMIIVFSLQGQEGIINGALTLGKMFLPLLLTIYVLAPWAGKKARKSTGAVFLAGAIAAVSMIAVFLIEALLAGVLPMFLIYALFWCMFALPASVLGSILFVGSCQRIHEKDEYGVESRPSA